MPKGLRSFVRSEWRSRGLLAAVRRRRSRFRRPARNATSHPGRGRAACCCSARPRAHAPTDPGGQGRDLRGGGVAGHRRRPYGGLERVRRAPRATTTPSCSCTTPGTCSRTRSRRPRGVRASGRRLRRDRRGGGGRTRLELLRHAGREPRRSADGRAAGDVEVYDPANPSTKGLPRRWRITDSWYTLPSNPRGNVHVLAGPGRDVL